MVKVAAGYAISRAAKTARDRLTLEERRIEIYSAALVAVDNALARGKVRAIELHRAAVTAAEQIAVGILMTAEMKAPRVLEVERAAVKATKAGVRANTGQNDAGGEVAPRVNVSHPPSLARHLASRAAQVHFERELERLTRLGVR